MTGAKRACKALHGSKPMRVVRLHIVMKLSDIQRSQRQRHDKAFGKLVDRPAMGTRLKRADARMDTSTPCPHCNGTGKDVEGVKCQTGKCLTCDGLGRTRKDGVPNGVLCLTCDGTGEVKTCNGRGRVQMDALGTVKHVNGKANGPVASPSTYRAWLAADRPAHPIYNRDALYTNGILRPTAGIVPEPVVVRHTPDCDCGICREFRGHIQRPMTTRIDSSVLSPVPYGPWPRPNGLVPPIRRVL